MQSDDAISMLMTMASMQEEHNGRFILNGKSKVTSIIARYGLSVRKCWTISVGSGGKIRNRILIR
ncbi:MAG: hypothetical protein Ct9H90mP27_6250 [Gammaproteobacteria bacterium]|nr:MAG: hypothetical protein Ct9H90mP27_6250 [Gammaproteobacteria bacterium]